MAEMRWEWTLPGGEQVAAELSADATLESVYVGGELASRSARGAKPDGHALKRRDPGDPSEEREVLVTFDPRAPICILRVDGIEVHPSKWPVRRAPAAAPAPRRAPRVGGVAVAVLLAILVAGAFAVRPRCAPDAAEDPTALTEAHRAASGLFVAHFPPTYTARKAVAPGRIGGVILEDAQRAADVVVLATPLDGEPTRDPWVVQSRVHGEALANLPRSGGTYAEVARRDERCLGEPGAVVTGRVTNRKGDLARVWSCAIVRGGAAYLFMYSYPEAAPRKEEARVRAIVDATELTRLGEMGSP